MSIVDIDVTRRRPVYTDVASNTGCTLIQDTKHLYHSCPITKMLYSKVKLFLKQLRKKLELSLVANINTMLFHTFSNKEFIEKQPLLVLISAVKYTIWKLNTENTDPDLPPEICLLNFVTNAIWVVDAKLECTGHQFY